MSFGVLFKAATGMHALGTGMQTVSNNLANVNTVGYKAMRTNYEDLISQCYFSGGNHNQIGKGAKVSTIQTIFNQGAFKTSESDTDMAIAGEGFFNVRNRQTGEIVYTRSGVYTFDKEGYLQDPSNNILQGWAMAIPKPGQKAVRIGEPVDIKIDELKMPPSATTTARSVSNLSAGAAPAYEYPKNELAAKVAEKVTGNQANSAKIAAELAVWDQDNDTPVSASSSSVPTGLTASNKADFNENFLREYNALYGTSHNVGSAASFINGTMQIVSGTPNRANGEMTASEFTALVSLATSKTKTLATEKGKDAYAAVYNANYTSAYNAAEAQFSDGEEGMGFAGAWNGSVKPPIAAGNYSHAEPLKIYDEAGQEHTMMIYYQKNPHMENVWDYIITCDPSEDARVDSDGNLLNSGDSPLAGLIQKGKLTFDTNGNLKDMEAYDFDLSSVKMASSDDPIPDSGASSAMSTASIGGYYTGSPEVDENGQVVSSSRTYTLTWGYKDPATGTWSSNSNTNPPTSGVTWTDDLGNTGYFAVDKEYPGPYQFGEGLTVTFDLEENPSLSFGAPGTDAFSVTAHSEQTAWSEAQPNSDGLFEFSVAFNPPGSGTATSGSSIPPPGSGQPLKQTIALDLGARKTAGSSALTLDGVSTTQYGGIRSTTVSKEIDGYPESSLQRAYVREDGVVVGVYSNKQEQELYQVCLTRFRNPNGLSKRGDNYFGTTGYSDPGITLAPGEGGAGQILGNFLEQSTVDTATEIVQMIITQRGFQANSKTVTTKDTMLATAIQLKK